VQYDARLIKDADELRRCINGYLADDYKTVRVLEIFIDECREYQDHKLVPPR
jgi:hypothetical protein